MAFFSIRRDPPVLNFDDSLIIGRNNLNNSINTTHTKFELHTPEEFDEMIKIGNGVFYFSAVLIVLMGLFCTVGNGLVLYISNKNKDFGGFREINSVVKQLALSDFLFGLVGCPLTIVWWYWGKKYHFSVSVLFPFLDEFRFKLFS